MILLDAFALLAYFRGEPAAEVVQQMLWDNDVAMSQVQAAETIDRMMRIDGCDEDEAEIAISAIGVKLIDIDAGMGAAAGRFRAAHYIPTGRTLSLADSFAAVIALDTERQLATSDPVLIEAMRRAGHECLELPRSS